MKQDNTALANKLKAIRKIPSLTRCGFAAASLSPQGEREGVRGSGNKAGIQLLKCLDPRFRGGGEFLPARMRYASPFLG